MRIWAIHRSACWWQPARFRVETTRMRAGVGEVRRGQTEYLSPAVTSPIGFSPVAGAAPSTHACSEPFLTVQLRPVPCVHWIPGGPVLH